MNKSIAILGAGESGIGAALLGKKHEYAVFVSDAGFISEDQKKMLHAISVDFEESTHTEERILAVDEIIKSPGIPDTAPIVLKARERGIPVISEIEFAYRYISENAKVIAITGTNGKTTTTLLAYHLMVTAGYHAALGGNVGVSLAKLVAEGGYDYYVVEVSSFQLDGIVKFKPDVAVLLNITPDHLDRYDNDFNKYVASKFRITENLSRNECFVYSADSEPVTEEVAKRRIDACLFAVSATNDPKWQAHMDDKHLIFDYRFKESNKRHRIPVSEIALIGKHNMLNSMAAVLSVLAMEVSMEKVLKGLKSFKNAPHRMEVCGSLEGVRYINDSKATNVDAVYYALDGIQQDIVWIAGGTDKGNDYAQITDLVMKKVKGLVCLGVQNDRLLSHFGQVVKRMVETRNVSEAVNLAADMADPGDVVLLSPACASFDLFKNYEDRGNQFKQAVSNLIDSKQSRV